jgi:hypothetical protein
LTEIRPRAQLAAKAAASANAAVEEEVEYVDEAEVKQQQDMTIVEPDTAYGQVMLGTRILQC